MPRPLSIQRSISTDVRLQPRQPTTASTAANKTKKEPYSRSTILAPEVVVEELPSSLASPSSASARKRSSFTGASALVSRPSPRSKKLDTSPSRQSGNRRQQEEEAAEAYEEEERGGEDKVLKNGKTVSELQLEYDLLAETLTARQQETVLLCRLLCAIYSKWQQMVKAMPQQLVTQQEEDEEEEEEDDAEESKRRRRHSKSKSKEKEERRKERRRSRSSDSSHDKKRKKRHSKKKKERTFLPIKSSTDWDALQLPTEWISYFQLYYPINQSSAKSRGQHQHQQSEREASLADIPLLVDVLPSNYWEQLVDGAQRVVRGMDGLLHGGGGSGSYSTPAAEEQEGNAPPPLPPQPARVDTALSALSESEQMVRDHHHHHHRHRNGDWKGESPASVSRGPAHVKVHEVFEEGPQALLSGGDDLQQQQQYRRPPPPPPPPLSASSFASSSPSSAQHQQQQQQQQQHSQIVRIGSGHSSSSTANTTTTTGGYPVNYNNNNNNNLHPSARGDTTQTFSQQQHEEEDAAIMQQYHREDQVHADVARLAEERVRALEAQLRAEREERLRQAEEARRRGEQLQQQLQQVVRGQEETEMLVRQQQQQEQQQEREEGSGKKKRSVWAEYADTLLDEEKRRMEQINSREFSRRQANHNNTDNNEHVESFVFDPEKDVILRAKLSNNYSKKEANGRVSPPLTRQDNRYAQEGNHLQNEIELNKAIIEQQFSAQQRQRQASRSGPRFSPPREDKDGAEEESFLLERKEENAQSPPPPAPAAASSVPPHWEQAQPGVWAAATRDGYGVSRATTPPTATATVASAALLTPPPLLSSYAATSLSRRSPASLIPPPGAELNASWSYPDTTTTTAHNRRTSPLSIQRSTSHARQSLTTARATTANLLQHQQHQQQQQRVRLNTSANETSPPPRLPATFRFSTVLTHSHSHPNVNLNMAEMEREKADFDNLEHKKYFNDSHVSGTKATIHVATRSKSAEDGTHLLPSPISPARDQDDDGREVKSENGSPHRFFDIDAKEEQQEKVNVENLSDESTEPLSATRNKTKVYNNNNNNNNNNNAHGGYVNYWSSSS